MLGLFGYTSSKKKKNSGSKCGPEVEPLKIRTTSTAVITLIQYFENGENNTFGSTEPQNENDIYNTFLSFIRANKNGKKLPQARLIEEHLSIKTKKRKELAKRAFEAGILRKPTPNSYEFID
ncbi:MAG: hypothetical protein ABF289_18080 [Clostridiales bacterium]